jgi:hypothetical protein
MRLSLTRLLRMVVAALSFLFPSRSAHAGWPGDHELEREDLFATGGHRAGAGDLRGRSWISLAAFERVFTDRRDFGVLAVVGIALDRIAAGPVHAIADPTPPLPTSASTKERAPPLAAPIQLDPALARATVAAAWRAVGLGVDDAKIDAIIARAHQSAALPETRLRAMRLVNETGHVDSTTTTNDIRYYDAAGANLWLEARLTWRLDRLLYADDEPTLERVRLERIEARGRVAAKIMEALFQWQHALVDVRDAPPGTREQLDAQMRVLEAEIALDVLTAGWFTRARPHPPLAAPAAPRPT